MLLHLYTDVACCCSWFKMTDVVTSVHRCCCSWLKMTDVITSEHRCCWRWFKMTDDILRWYCQHLKLADDIGLKGKNTDVITSVHRCCWSWFKMTDDILRWYCRPMKLADDIGQSCTDDLGLLYRWCWTDVVIFPPLNDCFRSHTDKKISQFRSNDNRDFDHSGLFENIGFVGRKLNFW